MKTTNPATYLGFSKTYNFVFFFIFGGALLGFTLARFQYLNFNIFCGGGASGAAPGECYWYGQNFYKAGILIHLGCILPASLLAIFQFVPIIRYKVILFHRINGYVIILLVVTSTVGALMILRRAFGGGLDTQAGLGLLAIMSLCSLGSAIVSIKRLHIDAHRAWMLRAWFYLGSIITVRLIMIIAVQVMSSMGSWYTVRPCVQIAFVSEADAISYSNCASYLDGTNPDALAIVHVDFSGTTTEIGASLGVPFGMAVWLALAIHAIAVEVYLNLTSSETERLRMLSAERRAEAGMLSRIEKASSSTESRKDSGAS